MTNTVGLKVARPPTTIDPTNPDIPIERATMPVGEFDSNEETIACFVILLLSDELFICGEMKCSFVVL